MTYPLLSQTGCKKRAIRTSTGRSIRIDEWSEITETLGRLHVRADQHLADLDQDIAEAQLLLMEANMFLTALRQQLIASPDVVQ